jgi:hypothetical protein
MPRIAVDKDLVTVQPTLIATMDSRRPPDLDHDLIRRAEGMHIGSRVCDGSVHASRFECLHCCSVGCSLRCSPM